MPSTYTGLHYHLIFATQNREPLMTQEIRGRIHEYLGGTVRGLGGVPHGIGGMADHVHLLVDLKASHCLADFMRELKKNSSHWASDTLGIRSFQWQEGYAGLTVSPSGRSGVVAYIASQEEHHARRTFREELIELLDKAGIEYDPTYLD